MTKRPVPTLSDEREAQIQRMIASDPDAAEATDEALANPMTFAEAMKRPVGRPKSENPKRQVTVRLDADVIAKMRESGPGWQVRMNDILRKGFRA
ncbi:MAG: BrnA antitoxin family protein [Devosia sp.]